MTDYISETFQELKDAKLTENQKAQKKALRKLFYMPSEYKRDEVNKESLTEPAPLVAIINKCCGPIPYHDRQYVMNTAFEDIFKNIETFKNINSGKACKAWCIRIVKNKYKDFIKEEKAKKRGGDATIVTIDTKDSEMERIELDAQKEKGYSSDISIEDPSLTDIQLAIVKCMKENFKLFAMKEPERAFAIALKHQDVYDKRAYYFFETIGKFIFGRKRKNLFSRAKLSSDDISIILDRKNANAINTYISESKIKLQPFIKKCTEII